MIPFPFTLFSQSDLALLVYTGLYEAFDIYNDGFRDTYKSGFVYENGFNLPRTGFSTGTSFLASSYFVEPFDQYASGALTGFTTDYSGVFNPLPVPLYTTGKAFNAYSFIMDDWRKYPIVTGDSLIFTGLYSGWTASGPMPYFGTGTTIWGWIPPVFIVTGTSFVNHGASPPATFTGSGLIFTGGWDRAGNTRLGYNNKESGLFLRNGTFLQLYKDPAAINDFTVEFQMRRSGWGDADARLIDHNSQSGFTVSRNASTDFLRAGVTGSAFNCDVSISEQSWTHVAFVKSGISGTFYISGMRRNSGPQINFTILNNWDYFIGRRMTNGNSQQYQGWIDEVRIWNYVRSRDEIASGATGSIVNSAGLIGYLKL